MDTAQITGSTSSYARKYALQGLFALDDGKDPDAQDNTEHVSQAPANYPPKLKENHTILARSIQSNDVQLIKTTWRQLDEETRKCIWPNLTNVQQEAVTQAVAA